MEFSSLLSKGVAMMQTASFPIPYTRRAAAVESVRCAKDESTLIDIFLDLVTGSPFIPDEQKNHLANLVLLKNWDRLAEKSACDVSHERLLRNASEQTQFFDFRDMVLSIFRDSRKFQILPAERKRKIGANLLATSSKDEIMELFFRTLPESLALCETEKYIVANDVLEGRFYRLLLPDRLDCDEMPRQYASDPSAPPSELDVECPICLGTLPAQASLLPCGHSFCVPCLDGWFGRTHRGCQERTCPLCQEDVPKSQVRN